MLWSYLIIALCIVFGILLWLAEIFLLPGLSVAGILGTVFMGGSVWYAFANIGLSGAIIVLIINLVLLGFGIYYFIKSRALDKIALNTVLPGKALEDKQQEVSVGDVGVTESRLAPYGKAIFNGKSIEVKVSHSFVESNVEVKVVSVNDNVVVVQPIQA